MSESTKKEITAVVMRPAGIPDANGIVFTEEALAAAVEMLNKRRHVSGEYGTPRLRNYDEARRYIQVDEKNAVAFGRNFRMSDQGMLADVTMYGPYGSIAQKIVDEGGLDRGEVAFSIRPFILTDDIKDGMVTKFAPIAVDFVNLPKEKK
jgi:hypothetical protein